MNNLFYSLSIIFCFVVSPLNYATPDRAQLAVWANEAVIATYTYNYKTYVQDQKAIAQYFTAEGWITYSKALSDSKLPESVQKNAYDVSAVATQPPKLITLDPTHWQVIMTILVVYKNPQYQQQQNLKVQLNFSQAAAGQGMRGFNITSIQTSAIDTPCQCSAVDLKPLTTTGNGKK